MSQIIDQFIWKYQHRFQTSLQLFAKKLFDTLDPRLNPHIFLVGIHIADVENKPNVCLEPEDCGYSQESFKTILELSQNLEVDDTELRISLSQQIAQENQNLKLKNNALRKAILKIIQRDSPFSDKISYVSFPTEKQGYLVFSILQLNKSAYESHYRLQKTKYGERHYISVSLIHSTVTKFLETIPHELNATNAGANSDFLQFECDEIIKSSGKNFMYSVSSKGNNVEGLYGLFEACNIISSLKYEGEEGLGGITISYKDHPNIKMELVLDNPIKISEYRKVRKFLELSDDNYLLISDSYLIYGVGKIVGNYNLSNEDLIVIRFTNHYHWEVNHAANCLMKVSYNQPFLPKNTINKEKFYSDVIRIFQDIKKSDLNNLWLNVIEAINQKRGTMLVITEGASKEVLRLKEQCFPVEPIKLNEKLTSKITSIDGSVLLAPNGTCFAIGVILDGIATKKGDSSRGSRYNSATRYYEFIKKKYPCLIIVVSEDGMVDLIPNLMPQIKKSAIKEKIDSLNKILASKYYLNVKQFNFVMDWLTSHNFYLSQQQCDEINNLRKHIEEKISSSSDEDNIKIIRKDLEPNEKMNESYLIE